MCAHCTNFQRLDGNLQIIDRACRRCEVQDIVQIAGNVNELGYIVMIEFKFFELKKMLNVIDISCDEIVHRNNMIAFINKLVA